MTECQCGFGIDFGKAVTRDVPCKADVCPVVTNVIPVMEALLDEVITIFGEWVKPGGDTAQGKEGIGECGSTQEGVCLMEFIQVHKANSIKGIASGTGCSVESRRPISAQRLV